jgi:hypothetical protein
LLQNKGDSKVKLLADAGATDDKKDAFFLQQQYKKFE